MLLVPFMFVSRQKQIESLDKFRKPFHVFLPSRRNDILTGKSVAKLPDTWKKFYYHR
jgi:hypothetical protein